MNFMRLAAITGTVLLLAAIAPQAGHAAKAKVKEQHATGKVTTIDPSGNSITITDTKTSTTTVVTLSADTKFVRDTVVPESSLQTGDKIRAQSKTDLTPGATTVDASRIEILSPLSEDKKKEVKKSVEGTVVTVTPALTISTSDNNTVTITTDEKTKVLQPSPAAFSDIIVGDHIQATGQLNGTTLAAKKVTISAPKSKK